MSGQVPRVAWFRFRATFRRRLGGYLVLAVLIGIVGGVAMASMVAARRTDASYPKFLASTNPSDLIIQPNGGGTGATAGAVYRSYLGFLSQLARLPHVQKVRSGGNFTAATLTPSGGIGTVLQSQVQLIASTDGLFSGQDKVTMTAGQRPIRRGPTRSWPAPGPPPCWACTWDRGFRSGSGPTSRRAPASTPGST